METTSRNYHRKAATKITAIAITPIIITAIKVKKTMIDILKIKVGDYDDDNNE